MDAATHRLLDARRHPGRRPVMRQSWDHLFFLHWRVDPAEVAKRLPAGLSVDTFEGQAYLGIVGFRMSQVRPAGSRLATSAGSTRQCRKKRCSQLCRITGRRPG